MMCSSQRYLSVFSFPPPPALHLVPTDVKTMSIFLTCREPSIVPDTAETFSKHWPTKALSLSLSLSIFLSHQTGHKSRAQALPHSPLQPCSLPSMSTWHIIGEAVITGFFLPWLE